jgi:hypothetical protein
MPHREEVRREKLKVEMKECLKRIKELRQEVQLLWPSEGETIKQRRQRLSEKSLLLDELLSFLERYNECYKLLYDLPASKPVKS